MNINDVKSLTDKQLRVRVASALGIINIEKADYATCDIESTGCWYGKKNGMLVDVPDYPNDLNAMHEIINDPMISGDWSRPQGKGHYLNNLSIVVLGRLPFCDPDWWLIMNATARQRAQAFVLTMGGEG